MSESPKVHRPLTGLEVVEAIVAETRRALLATGQFDAHTTFIEARWQGGFRVSGYLRRPVVVKAEGMAGAGPREAPDEPFSASAEVVHGPQNPEGVRKQTAEAIAEAERARAEAAESAGLGAQTPQEVGAVPGDILTTVVNTPDDGIPDSFGAPQKVAE